MPASTRQEILQLFAKNTTLTARDISKVLGLSPVDVRYHLQILLKEKKIEELLPDSTSPRKVGRPSCRYRLTSTSDPENLEILIRGFIKQLSQFIPEPFIWESLAETIFPENLNAPLPSRLRHSMEVLENLNYSPKWEATQSGPKIIFRHCPYISLWKTHPQICIMDQVILQRLTGIQFQQFTRMHKHQESACVFYPESVEDSSQVSTF